MRHIEIKFFDSMEWALYNKKMGALNSHFFIIFFKF